MHSPEDEQSYTARNVETTILFSPIRVFYFLFRTSIENHQCYITLKQTNIKALLLFNYTCTWLKLYFLV